VSYELGGVRYLREVLVSAPDQVIVVRFTADRPRALSLDVTLDRPENGGVSAAQAGLLLSGQLPDGKGGTEGVRYAARVQVLLPGGGEQMIKENTVEIRGADEVLLLVAAITDMRSFAGRRADRPAEAVAEDLRLAAGKSFAEIRTAQVADHARWYERVSLRLAGSSDAVIAKPTPSRLRELAAGGNDPDLMALLFDFGRYLLISASRPGGLPANLQGLWAEEVQTPWNADWHLNVNVQMNYWPAEVCGLGELHEPLFRLIESLQEPGARTAQRYYGARGWVAHVLANPWGFTSPGERASWGSANSGSAWLCQHLWDHFLFTRDLKFLEWAYPILRGSAQFYLDLLIEEPTHRWLVTAPSNSPENGFRMPDGRVAHVCMGPTIDQQLLRYLFDACIQAAELLNMDPVLRVELAEKRRRLAPTRIGSDGRIMEWLEEYPEPEPTHRHVSHLWGLYPGHEISAVGTPELAQAAQASLVERGDAGTGWSLAYKLNLWARLRDGDRCERILRTQLAPVPADVRGISTRGGGTYPNLFGSHPPFQIDGNFGATAGIAEMLLQSHAEGLDLLPALPLAWSEGEVKGLCARPNLVVDLAWREGRLVSALIRSAKNVDTKLRHGGLAVPLRLAPGEIAHFDGTLRRR
jgi:alpha-L-fucosidase 2